MEFFTRVQQIKDIFIYLIIVIAVDQNDLSSDIDLKIHLIKIL
jgi:hypothetical protein